jgi:hypothetical protein
MDVIVRVVRWQAYNCYHEHPELLEPMFHLFSRQIRPSMRNASCFKQDLRPPTSISPQIAHFIRVNFIWQGRPFDRPIFKPLILTLAQDFVAKAILTDTALIFKFSYHRRHSY